MRMGVLGFSGGVSNNLSEKGAGFGIVCLPLSAPFAPTLDKGLTQNPGRSRCLISNFVLRTRCGP